jgi:hypothetical protein
LSNEVLLLESGLDSLGFAILVATLEEKLGFDPFTTTEEPIYPKTFGEFVRISKYSQSFYNDCYLKII